jgi:hypothetical protein
VFENRVLRRIFGPKRDEVTGKCRGLRNEEFHNFYSSLRMTRMTKSRRMRWASNLAQLVRKGMKKSEGKRPQGRP